MKFDIVFTLSDCIEIIGIVCSLITSIVAIVISIKTLRQNSKMIEDASRPYLGIYNATSLTGIGQSYIILKNFGQSSAYINCLECNIDLLQISKDPKYRPFSCIEKTTIMPGQSFRAAIDYDKAAEIGSLTFRLIYTSGTKVYIDDIVLHPDSNHGNLETHSTPKEEQGTLSVISETLQDMHIKSL